MSSRPRRKTESIERLVEASRAYTTAAVMFHHAVASRFGLSVTDLKTLDLLQRLGPLTAGQIAARTGLATPSVTSLIDRLEKKRLARRERDRKDRRRVLVEPTGELEKRIAPLFASLGEKMQRRFQRYTDEQMAVIREFLAGCAREMNEQTAKLEEPAARKKR